MNRQIVGGIGLPRIARRRGRSVLDEATTNIPGVSIHLVEKDSNLEFTVTGDANYAGSFAIAASTLAEGLPIVLAVPSTEHPGETFTCLDPLVIYPVDDPAVIVSTEWYEGGIVQHNGSEIHVRKDGALVLVRSIKVSNDAGTSEFSFAIAPGREASEYEIVKSAIDAVDPEALIAHDEIWQDIARTTVASSGDFIGSIKLNDTHYLEQAVPARRPISSAGNLEQISFDGMDNYLFANAGITDNGGGYYLACGIKGWSSISDGGLFATGSAALQDGSSVDNYSPGHFFAKKDTNGTVCVMIDGKIVSLSPPSDDFVLEFWCKGTKTWAVSVDGGDGTSGSNLPENGYLNCASFGFGVKPYHKNTTNSTLARFCLVRLDGNDPSSTLRAAVQTYIGGAL